jgi:hypothetical protein
MDGDVKIEGRDSQGKMEKMGTSEIIQLYGYESIGLVTFP